MIGARVMRTLSEWSSRPKAPGFEEFLAELGTLGLKGTEFDAHAYARALERHLAYAIEVEKASDLTGRGDLAHRVLSSLVRQAGAMGVTQFFPDADPPRFLILTADGLNPWLYQHTVFHELAHVTAGHPFRHRLAPLAAPRPNGRSVDGTRVGGHEETVRFPPRRLALRRPFLDENLCESEADLRAEYAILAGNLGQISLQKDNLNQAG